MVTPVFKFGRMGGGSNGGGGAVPPGPTAPTVVSVVAATQTSIVLTLNQAASGTEALGFTFSGTTSVTVASATGLPSNTITFNINETLYNDSNVLLSYASGTGDIVGVVGGIDLASFSNSLVTVSGLPAPSAGTALTLEDGITALTLEDGITALVLEDA